MATDALVGGKYRLVRRIGLGAMGEVWEAVNVDTDREVALKLITRSDPELRRRLVREARAIGRLNHPNVVQILDRGDTENGEPFLVMQLLQGETLAQRLRRERSLTQPVAAGIALDIARALRVAHEKQIVHRDLKPGNIFLHREPDTEEDVVKVVDFGVSKMTVEGDQGTLTDGIVGSPAYMSPEQIRSSAVDGRADVWALGVMLFEMLAGQRPFAGAQPVTVLQQILSQPVPRIESLVPDVSPALGNVIAGCIERDLSLRIASAAELIRLLRPFSPRGRFATVEDAEMRGRLASFPDVPLHDVAANSPRLPSVALPAAPAPEAAPPAVENGRESDAPTGIFQPSALLRAADPADRTTSKMPHAPAQPPAGGVAGKTLLMPHAVELPGAPAPPPGAPPPAPPAPAPAPPVGARRPFGGTLPMQDFPSLEPDPNQLVDGGTMPIDPRLIPPSPAASSNPAPRPAPPPPAPPVLQPGAWMPSASAGSLRGTLPLDGPPMPLPETAPLPAPPVPPPPDSVLVRPPVSRWPTVLLLFAVVAFMTAVTLLFATLWRGAPAPAGSASEPPAKTP